MKRVAILGGGLAGLAAAADLVAGGADVTIFESQARLGGQICTRRERGFVVEDGAEGWVAADPDVPALCRQLGIESELIRQAEKRSLLFSRGELAEMQAGDAARLLGIPASDSDLGGGIASLRGGTGALIDALTGYLRGRARVHTGAVVDSLEPRGRVIRIHLTASAPAEADAILVTVPAPAAARILRDAAPDAAEIFRRVQFISNVSVSLAYDRAAVSHPLAASGLVVDSSEELGGLRACAFSSSKFSGRAPAGQVLLRAFFRPQEVEVAQVDEEWVARAVRLLTPMLGISGPPSGSWVARWPMTLPLYGAAHRETMDATAEILRQRGAMDLAGTSFFPSGIPGAIRSARAAVQRLLT